MLEFFVPDENWTHDTGWMQKGYYLLVSLRALFQKAFLQSELPIKKKKCGATQTHLYLINFLSIFLFWSFGRKALLRRIKEDTLIRLNTSTLRFMKEEKKGRRPKSVSTFVSPLSPIVWKINPEMHTTSFKRIYSIISNSSSFLSIYIIIIIIVIFAFIIYYM